jgi:GAF domain-containing protein
VALLVGFDGESVEACLRSLMEELRFLVADSEAEALRLLDAHPVAVLALGAGVSGERARRLLEAAEAIPEAIPAAAERVNVVLAAGPDPALFRELIDGDRLFYLSQDPMAPGDMIVLLRSAAVRWRAAALADDEEERRRAALAHRLLAAAQAIAGERQPEGAARTAAEKAADVAGADRGYCLLYDPATDTLWEGAAAGEEERRESAAVGLLSFVVRTGQPLSLERIGRDPRFDRQADDPQAVGDERFAAVPVLGPDGGVLAVLAAVRTAGGRPFAGEDLDALARLAEQAAPVFAQLRLAEEDRSGLPAAGLFREEAIEHHRGGLRGEGDVLRADPGWMRWTYRLLVGVLAASLLFSLLARVREYAAGPAVVRLGGPQVVAFLPGEYRPLLKPGMPLRLELKGYRYAYQHLLVDAVEDEVVGPAEAQRYLGAGVAGAAGLDGPLVRISARLASDTFKADGGEWRYHDGMLGRAEVQIRSERVLTALIPALKTVLAPREAGDA